MRWDELNWWMIIKIKSVGHVKVKNSLAIEYQNDSSSVQEIMDIKLEDKLEHPDHIYEEIGLEQDTYMKK